MLHAEENTVEIDCQAVAPGLHRHFVDEGAAAADPGVVHHDIEVTGFFDDLVDDGAPDRFVGDIVAAIMRRAAGFVDRGDDVLSGDVLDVGDIDFGAFCRQQFTGLRADAGRAARDQCHLACNSCHDVLLPIY